MRAAYAAVASLSTSVTDVVLIEDVTAHTGETTFQQSLVELRPAMFSHVRTAAGVFVAGEPHLRAARSSDGCA